MGPILLSVTNWVLNQIERLMRNKVATQTDCKVYIVGHSRGAAAAIGVANRIASNAHGFFSARTLVKPPVIVEYVGLYDTVDRSLFTGQDVAMSNVKSYLHAQRRNRGFVDGSRWSFDTVDLDPGRTETFDTAHGGVGGDPGYFTRLDAFAADLYCNAVRIVMTSRELLLDYLVRSSHSLIVAPLDGAQRAAQLARVQTSIREVNRADDFIRRGASVAGIHLTACSVSRQHGDRSGHRLGEDQLFARLRAAS